MEAPQPQAKAEAEKLWKSVGPRNETPALGMLDTWAAAGGL